MQAMTYGTMPSEEEYDEAFERDAGDFRFGNDPRVGTCALTRSELWAELKRAHAETEAGDEAAGEWCSAVLGCLGFEWV